VEDSDLNITAADNITELLTKFLDIQSRRAEVVSSNIANADTPNYVAKELKFDEYLNQAVNQVTLPSSERERFSQSTTDLRVVEQTPTAIGMDGNTVDTGKEMADLAQIGTNFNFGAKILQSRLRLLRTAIREGR
jgi:flagellar basal-body rod protein FlgB